MDICSPLELFDFTLSLVCPREEGGLPCSCNVAAAGCGIQKYAAAGVNSIKKEFPCQKRAIQKRYEMN